MRMFSKFMFFLIFVIFIGIQFIEVDRSNPPVTAEFKAPLSVLNIFRASCYDCHSNTTKWPWYSKVAPVSFLIASDVNEGRKELNFSIWENYGIDQRIKLKEDIWEEINEEKMPMKMYTYLHPASVLTIDQENIIKKWSEGMLK